MLCISMKAGDYFTVGGSTVIQFNRLQGDRVHLVVNAPREVPVLRGEVLERGGGQRLACVFERALLEIGQTLDRMGDSPEVRTLREKLACIFPAP